MIGGHHGRFLFHDHEMTFHFKVFQKTVSDGLPQATNSSVISPIVISWTICGYLSVAIATTEITFHCSAGDHVWAQTALRVPRRCASLVCLYEMCSPPAPVLYTTKISTVRKYKRRQTAKASPCRQEQLFGVPQTATVPTKLCVMRSGGCQLATSGNVGQRWWMRRPSLPEAIEIVQFLT
jgi:hypothetical protein